MAVTTENVFVDSFWEGLDFVTNALDNVKARLYVDSRCVLFGAYLPGLIVSDTDTDTVSLTVIHTPQQTNTAASSTASRCWSRARWAPSATCR